MIVRSLLHVCLKEYPRGPKRADCGEAKLCLLCPGPQVCPHTNHTEIRKASLICIYTIHKLQKVSGRNTTAPPLRTHPLRSDYIAYPHNSLPLSLSTYTQTEVTTKHSLKGSTRDTLGIELCQHLG